MKKFVIDESRWFCQTVEKHHERWYGPNLHDSQTGLECCMGQISRQLGTPIKKMANKGFPSDVSTSNRAYRVLGEFERDVAEINDGKMSHRTRKAQLKKFFKDRGITITFTGSIKDAIKRIKAHYD